MKKHYQKYCMHLAYAIISTSTFLFTTKTFGQENNSLSISASIYEYMKDDLRIWPVLHDSIIETKRPVIFLDNEITDVNEIIGSYSVTPTKYRYATRDDRKGNYIENELVDNSKDFNEYDVTELIYLIYKKDDTGKLYVIEERDIKSITEYDQTQELLKLVQNQGFKVYETNAGYRENNYYIKSKACEIKLDKWTYSNLKKNPAFITTLDNDQTKLDALIKQTITHSKTLDKYLGLHRIQRNKMSTANITAWKNATIQAQKLNNQIIKMDEKYAGNYSFMPLNKLSNIRNEFSYNLGASKGVLGM